MSRSQDTLSRLDSTILFVLKKAHDKGINNLSRFELMKFVYLIEVNAQKFIGESFTHEAKFVRDKNGPISVAIYQSVTHLDSLGLIEIETQENTEYGFPRVCHRLKGTSPDLKFSDSETVFLNSVLNDYVGLNMKNLKTIVYETEPMVSIQREEKAAGVPVLKGKPLDLDRISLDEDILSAIMH